MHKLNFTNRFISVWNSLPDLVFSSDIVDVFKIRLDGFWIDQEMKYNWKADISIRSCRQSKAKQSRKQVKAIASMPITYEKQGHINFRGPRLFTHDCDVARGKQYWIILTENPKNSKPNTFIVLILTLFLTLNP